MKIALPTALWMAMGLFAQASNEHGGGTRRRLGMGKKDGKGGKGDTEKGGMGKKGAKHGKGDTEEKAKKGKKGKKDDVKDPEMMCASKYPFLGRSSSVRMLLREGIIDKIPADLCGNPQGSKNVILVIGDGMGWEMIRAGSIAKQIIDELEGMGCNTKTGCPSTTVGDHAMMRFEGRSLAHYYTEGKGQGLSFQNLPHFGLVMTGAPVIGEPNPGNHYAPNFSMLGNIEDHKRGMAPLVKDANGCDLEFNPTDYELEGGNMALWSDELGGEYPWDECYYNPAKAHQCDITFIMQHPTDSANTASTLATGVKPAAGMLSLDLYEEKVRTLVEEAMYCSKAGGVVTSVPVFHATPAAFILHANYRSDREALRRGYLEVLPTAAVGVCGGRYYPSDATLQSMRDGAMSSQFTLFEQKPGVSADRFWDGIGDLDPDNGDKIFACMGGDFSRSRESNMPYRGVDSSYNQRYCSSGTIEVDEDDNPAAVIPTTPAELCDHYLQDDVAEIPVMKKNVKETLEFLAKDDDGFFMMFEQGDIDWSAHANHMDDMLGTMLDINDSVQEIMDWIDANGGYEKNALYVTADHDHYLTLNNDFPEKLAKFIITGMAHMITPQNNSDLNPWYIGTAADRHNDDSKSQIEHLSDFTTWSDEDIDNVAHFWGPRGSGGNGWGSHSTRPVPVFYDGDNGCIEAFMGKGYQVLDKEVAGSPGKIDQSHLHACMLKNLFGL